MIGKRKRKIYMKKIGTKNIYIYNSGQRSNDVLRLFGSSSSSPSWIFLLPFTWLANAWFISFFQKTIAHNDAASQILGYAGGTKRLIGHLLVPYKSQGRFRRNRNKVNKQGRRASFTLYFI